MVYIENMRLQYHGESGMLNTIYPSRKDEDIEYYVYDSVPYDNVNCMVISDYHGKFDMTYLPEVYDYYLMITAFSETTTSNFTFAPNRLRILQHNCNSYNHVNIDNVQYYHHDKAGELTGFTLTGKLPELTSTAITYIDIFDDTLGSVPDDDLYIKVQIIQVDKNNSTQSFNELNSMLSKINDSVNSQGSSIVETITNGLDELQRIIEEQYSASDEENFGVEDIVDQVNEKAGVLSFGTDTLVNFLDLFDAANVTNTKLTFPGFSMEIQGVDYQVWPDYHYDLSELENQFGALIEVVRWGCVMCVWLAVLNYLVKAYDTIFGR